MQEYIDVMMTAARLFPLVAILFTLPYMIFQYYRYSSIMLLRVVILYSFILYLMCTALLTILPTPNTITAATQQTPQFIPFRSVRQWLAAANFNLLDPSTWKTTFFSRAAFAIFANILMMIPLGIYLRYYFECSFGKTFVITLGFSLILELIQLSGLFGLYPIAYRMFDVDDLITNTAGGIIGYFLSKWPMKVLPSQQQLNSVAYRKGLRVSFLRRLTATVVDWMLIVSLVLVVLYMDMPLRRYLMNLDRKWQLIAAGMIYVGAVLLYFIFGEWLLKGRTIGKRITNLRSVDSRSGKQPTLWQCIAKYAFLYYGYPSLLLTAAALFVLILRKYLLDSRMFTYGFVLMALYAAAVTVFSLRVLIRDKQLPHSALSRLQVVSTFRRRKESRGADHPVEREQSSPQTNNE